MEDDASGSWGVGEGADITTAPRRQVAQSASVRSTQMQSRRNDDDDDDDESTSPSNEYVLNVAFFSFLGFLLIQVVFALIAHSQAMLADSLAMFVDAFTYLFNLVAERIKKRPIPEDDDEPDVVRRRRRKRKVLLLEIVPPLISVVTLIAVSVVVLIDAVATILNRISKEAGETDGDADDMPNAWIMFIFSLTNLLLDVMNVTCFAKAKDFGFFMLHHLFGYGTETSLAKKPDRSTSHGIELEPQTESSRLISQDNYTGMSLEAGEEKKGESFEQPVTQNVDPYFEREERSANLNMCSAYTHVVADTLRSLAVVIAASLATIFDFIPPDVADATGAIVVSFIIAISLGPLLAGLFDAWSELCKLDEEERKEKELLATLMRDSVVDLRTINL